MLDELRARARDLTDRDLIDELKLRGYRVAKADRIRTASAEVTVETMMLDRYGRDLRQRLHDDLGQKLGVFLMRSGAVPVIEEIGPAEFQRRFRAILTVVVDNPEFDWPYPLKMER